MRKLLLTSASLLLTMGVALAQDNSATTQPPASSSNATNPAMGMNATGVTGQLKGSTDGQVQSTNDGASGGTQPGSVGSTSQGSSTSSESTGPGGIGATGANSGTGMNAANSGTGMNNANAPAMPSSSETTPPQRNSTMDRTMDEEHPKPMGEAASGSEMHHRHHMRMHHNREMNGSGETNDMEMSRQSSPSAYLRRAEMAIRHHQKARAEDEIGRAETDAMNAAGAHGRSNPADDSQVQTLSKARSAVMAGNYSEATSLIHQAMSNMNGSSGSGGMSNGSMGKGSGMSNGSMSNGSGMSNGSMNNGSGMSNGSMSNGSGMSNGSMSNGSGMSNGSASGSSGMTNNGSAMNNNASNAMGNNGMGAPAPATRGGAQGTPSANTPANQ